MSSGRQTAVFTPSGLSITSSVRKGRSSVWECKKQERIQRNVNSATLRKRINCNGFTVNTSTAGCRNKRQTRDHLIVWTFCPFDVWNSWTMWRASCLEEVNLRVIRRSQSVFLFCKERAARGAVRKNGRQWGNTRFPKRLSWLAGTSLKDVKETKTLSDNNRRAFLEISSL